MASIDKTYVNWNEYKEIECFFSVEMEFKQESDLGFKIERNKYVESDFFDNETRVLWNTSVIEDMWLANNCKLNFIQERLKSQYPKNWIGWENLKFNELGFLVSAKHNNSIISPFKKVDDNSVEVFDELLVYGTTFFHRFYHSIMNIVMGRMNRLYHYDSFSFDVEFEIFGLYIIAKSSFNGTKYYLVSEKNFDNPIVDENEISYGYFCGDSNFFRFFQKHKIKHSYDKSDFNQYRPEQIIMSHENECFNVDMYVDYSPEYLDRYLMLLPEYIEIK